MRIQKMKALEQNHIESIKFVLLVAKVLEYKPVRQAYRVIVYLKQWPDSIV